MPPADIYMNQIMRCALHNPTRLFPCYGVYFFESVQAVGWWVLVEPEVLDIADTAILQPCASVLFVYISHFYT